MGREFWEKVGKEWNDADAKEAIFTGTIDGVPFKSDDLSWVGGYYTVLDFGCGLGRNLAGLLSGVAHLVDGYDLPDMAARCAEMTPGYRHIYDDWSVTRTKHYDAIFASLVLQHIDHDELCQLLQDFKSMTGWLIINTRDSTDDGCMVLDLLSKAGWAFHVKHTRNDATGFHLCGLAKKVCHDTDDE